MNKLLFILLFPISVFSQSTQEQIDSLRYYMHKDLNEYRIQNNLEPLKMIDTLNKLAQSWAEYMYNNNDYRHSDYGYPENIQKRTEYIITLKQTAEDMLNSWKQSTLHNKAMLHKGSVGYLPYTGVGYGFYKGYAVQEFKYGF